MLDSTETMNPSAGESQEKQEKPEASEFGPEVATLVTFAGALLDTDKLLVTAALVKGPANRMELAAATGLSHRELLHHLDGLREAGLVRLKAPAPRDPDPYSPYELDLEAFRAARKAMGKFKGVKPRPSDARLMTLETFMPGGKLTAFPLKRDQILTVLNEIASRFEPEKQYPEREVNVILEDINEDYCTLRRMLVDYGYMTRSGGIYTKKV